VEVCSARGGLDGDARHLRDEMPDVPNWAEGGFCLSTVCDEYEMQIFGE
jgi:hypothetical protein